MMRKQRGVTMIGWIFLLTPLVLVLYAGLRVGPEYLNYYKVVQAMKKTATELKSSEVLTPQEITNSLEKRFDTGYIDTPTAREIIVKKGPRGWEMTAEYEPTVKFLGNLYLTMDFNTTVVVN